MDCLILAYKWTSRNLRKVIVSILKSWLAKNVKKMNYIQNYSMTDDKKIKKEEEKIFLVYTQHKEELKDFLSKNFQWIEKISIN